MNDVECPVCTGCATQGDYAVASTPVRTATVYAEHDPEAVARGALHLASCGACGLVFNSCFDPSTQDFSEGYEEAQDFSSVFRGYAHELAQRLTERYSLHGKRVLEIGCGKGGFLALLCRVAGATGVGIDPAADPSRIPEDLRDVLTVFKAEYGPEHRVLVEQADFVCCRHTLEHIFDPVDLLGRLREHLGDRTDVPLVVDVPSGQHVLDCGGFWDVYYEHCMYYSDEAFAAMLNRCGFDVRSTWREFDGQYLLAEAFPAQRVATQVDGAAELLAQGTRLIKAKRDGWDHWLGSLPGDTNVVLWGSGSRAVGFLSAVSNSNKIAGIVDINPFRAGKYMPGFDRAILSPDQLPALGCDAVIVMNPSYREEIDENVRAVGLPQAKVYTVDQPPVGA
jgi:SAM-dependent methyltransferase